jgi:threonine dehydratase
MSLASGGNHGMAVACAAQRLNIPSSVVLPSNAVTDEKLDILQNQFNSTAIVHGVSWNDSHDHALELVRQFNIEHPSTNGDRFVLFFLIIFFSSTSF